MAYLEELLPEFRNGAKIRRKSWPENLCISLRGSSGINIAFYDVEADDWEKVPDKSIDWNYIIKNKCLCWFGVVGKEKQRIGIVSAIANFIDSRTYYIDKDTGFSACRPVRKDEVTFYEDKRDGNN